MKCANNILRKKVYLVVKNWQCERWKFYKTGVLVKEQLRDSFTDERLLRRDQLVETKNQSHCLVTYSVIIRFPKN